MIQELYIVPPRSIIGSGKSKEEVKGKGYEIHSTLLPISIELTFPGLGNIRKDGRNEVSS